MRYQLAPGGRALRAGMWQRIHGWKTDRANRRDTIRQAAARVNEQRRQHQQTTKQTTNSGRTS